jgi:D-beta-D-heptose 7-phosphate kinase/D-beta-D-heptose 1-phosphate adenosyltransferase
VSLGKQSFLRLCEAIELAKLVNELKSLQAVQKLVQAWHGTYAGRSVSIYSNTVRSAIRIQAEPGKKVIIVIFLSSDDAAAEVARRQNAGEKVVFTNGVFDILHVGHLRYLQEARALGDALIVALNTDESVRAIKGPTRPINPEDERAELLSALRCVDYVTFFSDRTPVELVRKIKPAVYAKGGDYTVETLPEAPVVHAYGGEVKILSFVPGRSTTNVINRLASQNNS